MNSTNKRITLIFILFTLFIVRTKTAFCKTCVDFLENDDGKTAEDTENLTSVTLDDTCSIAVPALKAGTNDKEACISLFAKNSITKACCDLTKLNARFVSLNKRAQGRQKKRFNEAKEVREGKKQSPTKKAKDLDTENKKSGNKGKRTGSAADQAKEEKLLAKITAREARTEAQKKKFLEKVEKSSSGCAIFKSNMRKAFRCWMCTDKATDYYDQGKKVYKISAADCTDYIKKCAPGNFLGIERVAYQNIVRNFKKDTGKSGVKNPIAKAVDNEADFALAEEAADDPETFVKDATKRKSYCEKFFTINRENVAIQGDGQTEDDAVTTRRLLEMYEENSRRLLASTDPDGYTQETTGAKDLSGTNPGDQLTTKDFEQPGYSNILNSLLILLVLVKLI